MWITVGNDINEGERGFLIEYSNTLRGTSRHAVSPRPAHTNQSHQPRLSGWCGTWNDTATYADGMAEVVRVVAETGRALIRRLTPAETRRELERLGYPDLA